MSIEPTVSEPKKACKTVRRTVKKDGTVSVKEYDQSEYNKKCYEKNKEKNGVMIECGCGKKYNVFTKSNHCKSAFHKLYERIKGGVITEGVKYPLLVVGVGETPNPLISVGGQI